MPQQPVPADPGRDDDLAWLDRDPATAEERAAWLDRVAEADEPPEPEEYEDVAPLTAAELAEIRQAAADELLAVEAATTGRRGPGQPGSARVFPGESSSRAASFGPGMALDVLPGCPGLAAAADAAAGEDDDFEGVSDGELVGVLCAWDRVEAHAAARKLAAAAELIRRNPGPGCAPEGAARMPAAWDEFAADQLACALAESRGRADDPARPRAFSRNPAARHEGGAAGRDHHPVQGRDSSPRATALLDPAEARAAEDKVLDRAGPADPGRAARRDRPRRHGGRPGQGEGAAGDRGQGRPGGAVGRGFRQRRPDGLRAAARTRCWPPTSGSPRGRSELRKAGLDGDMDVAARPRLPRPAAGQGLPPPPRRRRADGAARPGPGPASQAPAVGAAPAGFAGRVTLTAPLATLPAWPTGPASSPGWARSTPGWPATWPPPLRATPRPPGASPSPTSKGHAIGHGCARPEPKSHAKRAGPGPPGGPGSPSPRPAGTGRPAATAPGGCAPRDPGRT